MGNPISRNRKIKVWPVFLGVITYIILNEIFDIPNLYDLLRAMF